MIDNVESNRGKYCNYDLIFMDCNMPFMDGYEATYKIREYLYNKNLAQPIISAITGHTEQAYIDKSILCGMNQVLSKPVQVEVLQHLIKALGFHEKQQKASEWNQLEKQPSESEIDVLEDYIEEQDEMNEQNEQISHSNIWKINRNILDETSKNLYRKRNLVNKISSYLPDLRPSSIESRLEVLSARRRISGISKRSKISGESKNKNQ